jgi:hypothetical protein
MVPEDVMTTSVSESFSYKMRADPDWAVLCLNTDIWIIPDTSCLLSNSLMSKFIRASALAAAENVQQHNGQVSHLEGAEARRLSNFLVTLLAVTGKNLPVVLDRDRLGGHEVPDDSHHWLAAAPAAPAALAALAVLAAPATQAAWQH